MRIFTIIVRHRQFRHSQLWLDFEVMLCVYDTQFAESLLALQQKYIEDSQDVNPMPGAADRQQSTSIENIGEAV